MWYVELLALGFDLDLLNLYYYFLIFFFNQSYIYINGYEYINL